MLESTKSHNSVQTALHALKWAHDLAGLDSPTENATVKLVAEGSKRIIGLKKVNRKEPLSTQGFKQTYCKCRFNKFAHSQKCVCIR